MATATNIELNLYRSQLLRAGVNAYHLETAMNAPALIAAIRAAQALRATKGN